MSQDSTDASFQACMEDHQDLELQPASDNFFSGSPTTNQNPTRYNLASERFIFEGEDEGFIISPSALANPYSGSTNEPLLPGYTISGGLTHLSSHSLDDWSADHPMELPFSRLLPQNRRRELSGMNYLNLCVFGIYVTVSILFGSGVVDWLPSPWTVTTLPEYETLLTPSQWAGDYLWIPVLSLEGIFAVVQLLPAVRSRPEVVEGVGYSFFYVALAQSLATILFCLKWIIPSWFALATTALFLLVLHLKLKQQFATTALHSSWKFWVFRFPFDVHLGWLLPLLAARASMLFRHYGKDHVAPLLILLLGDTVDDVGLQLGADIVAMSLLLPCAGAYLVRNHGPPDWVVPILILWAYIGIACRLVHTPEALVELYGKEIVEAVRGAAFCFAGVVSLFLIPRIFIWVARECLTIRVVQLTDDEEVDEEVEDLIINDPADGPVMTQF